ncbi:NUDIX domain-containing protein [Pseudomonas sp. Fl5BN2]|uniref:NUDIX hydrolase n=1 Tax=unclassified Pseudomonas TaxID=196821 RepID=UPI001376E8CA|nr:MULTISPECIES: NUDIX domain-containing protein [unclassified Pseudomonas]NBF04924.1 NUDIX domain-containing protein [Pseudomonas sp. Fl5BN2]NBF09164.1 NUDIX domain-containing protein [Pseudomonas sp. Fl4BN1]
MLANKACPVVLRRQGALEILAFRHPLAGLQLVKGTLEPGEATSVAAVRELAEEAGIQGQALRPLGIWQCAVSGQVWAFHECSVAAALPQAWSHFCEDDGGHEFRFFWHPLACEPSDQWHPLFQGALAFLRERLLAAASDT